MSPKAYVIFWSNALLDFLNYLLLLYTWNVSEEKISDVGCLRFPFPDDDAGLQVANKARHSDCDLAQSENQMLSWILMLLELQFTSVYPVATHSRGAVTNKRLLCFESLCIRRNCSVAGCTECISAGSRTLTWHAQKITSALYSLGPKATGSAGAGLVTLLRSQSSAESLYQISSFLAPFVRASPGSSDLTYLQHRYILQ